MRPTLSRRIAHHVPAFLACGLVVFFAFAAFSPAPPPEPSYALVEVADDGNLYVLDYGLTLEDCRRSPIGADRPVTFCEAEG